MCFIKQILLTNVENKNDRPKVGRVRKFSIQEKTTFMCGIGENLTPQMAGQLV